LSGEVLQRRLRAVVRSAELLQWWDELPLRVMKRFRNLTRNRELIRNGDWLAKRPRHSIETERRTAELRTRATPQRRRTSSNAFQDLEDDRLIEGRQRGSRAPRPSEPPEICENAKTRTTWWWDERQIGDCPARQCGAKGPVDCRGGQYSQLAIEPTKHLHFVGESHWFCCSKWSRRLHLRRQHSKLFQEHAWPRTEIWLSTRLLHKSNIPNARGIRDDEVEESAGFASSGRGSRTTRLGADFSRETSFEAIRNFARGHANLMFKRSW